MNQVIRYIKRAAHLGPKQTIVMIGRKLQSFSFDRKWRRKAFKKRASFSWQALAKRSRYKGTVEELHAAFKNASFPSLESLFVHNNLHADSLLQSRFSILGSAEEMHDEYYWHEDIRLKQLLINGGYHFDTDFYYKDFTVNQGTSRDLAKDIKVPWELGRLHHCSLLALAFYNSGQKDYAEKAQDIFCDWKKKNPFLLGVHWVCPMDVAIRAVNSIWMMKLLEKAILHKSSQAKELIFFQEVAESLYEHFFYLENNWETYDGVTSNHYLADLIGYLYCCWFFQSFPGMQKKINWAYQELLKELDKQVFEEGTDYEGSTSYHAMITEFFYHAWLLAPCLSYSLPASFEKKLKKMFTFIDLTRYENGEPLQIGDNDSGKLLFGISQQLVNAMKNEMVGSRHDYKKFGLSIYKNEKWHVSLRHHAYQKFQPSGHYHVDMGSVTIALHGIPLFVDPGSYIYTASTSWRNYFRSYKMHSIFYKKNEPLIALNHQLFKCALPESISEYYGSEALLETRYKMYQETALRQIHVQDREIALFDWWDNQNAIETEWRFILHPAIKPVKENKIILLHKENKLLAILQSDVEFNIEAGWYSPEYGVKLPTAILRGKKELDSQQKIIHRLLPNE